MSAVCCCSECSLRGGEGLGCGTITPLAIRMLPRLTVFLWLALACLPRRLQGLGGRLGLQEAFVLLVDGDAHIRLQAPVLIDYFICSFFSLESAKSALPSWLLTYLGSLNFAREIAGEFAGHGTRSLCLLFLVILLLCDTLLGLLQFLALFYFQCILRRFIAF